MIHSQHTTVNDDADPHASSMAVEQQCARLKVARFHRAAPLALKLIPLPCRRHREPLRIQWWHRQPSSSADLMHHHQTVNTDAVIWISTDHMRQASINPADVVDHCRVSVPLVGSAPTSD